MDKSATEIIPKIIPIILTVPSFSLKIRTPINMVATTVKTDHITPTIDN